MSRYGTYDLKYGFIPDDDCPEAPKLTNADRIRNMTVEELADWLYDWAGGAPNCDREGEDNKTCRECWLSWLKQEADT